MEMDATDEHFPLSVLSVFTDDEGNTDFNDSFSEVTGTMKPCSYRSRSAKKKLFSNKRTAELGEDDEELSPSMKRFRKNETNLLKFALTNSPIQQTDDNVNCIIRAVDRLTTEVDLVADGSRDYSLPTITGKHGDLKSISAETMADVVANTDMNSGDLMIIDCRYPYEYLGGHIKGAVNLYTKEEVHTLFELTEPAKPRILVFHCEFSSERGPKMYRFLRSCDRELNKDNYPRLNFPEVYLLEGGYKEFYHTHQDLCDPCGYKPMLHKDHASDLRHFRVKSKSWAGGHQRKHPSKSRLSRSCLSF
ncbi:M-phase inducer phosphatase-like [Mercenaria mercenaria]|uniref:M-phase inducer phosphatase-like n=1 Tax=Mercenaria mercenaria TaxID=6596 RepID=UPI00234EACE2|nr:M-phase inducer phosphatase-like [Mercenaria mercenaria]